MTDTESGEQCVLEITIYGVVFHILLDNVDAVMEAEPEEDMSESL
ncbi:MAG: hypothetical protein ABF459_04480 [Gluconobacter cerinus]